MKKYTIEFLMDDKGSFSVNGRNDGFYTHEIVGLLNWKLDDIFRQMRGEIKPDTINREVVVDASQESPKEAGE